MITIILIALAAICKAIADTIAHHYFDSVFNGSRFFNPNIQGKKLPFTNYPFDGWHLANSGMICFFLLAAFSISFKFLIGGLIFVVVFNLFYNKILR